MTLIMKQTTKINLITKEKLMILMQFMLGSERIDVNGETNNINGINIADRAYIYSMTLINSIN